MKKNVAKNAKNVKKKKSQKNQVLAFIKLIMLMAFFVFEVFLYKNYKNKEEIILEKQNAFNAEISEKFESYIRKVDFYKDTEYIKEYYAKEEAEKKYKLTTIVSQNSKVGGEIIE